MPSAIKIWPGVTSRCARCTTFAGGSANTTWHTASTSWLALLWTTDQQLTTLAVRTGQQRMNSTQIASNIVIMSRWQLTVEAIQRLRRVPRDADRQHATG